tara:strand:+ start:690 stop:884 length:195 start_codon:yes stop_codon:yes gene_type:complete
MKLFKIEKPKYEIKIKCKKDTEKNFLFKKNTALAIVKAPKTLYLNLTLIFQYQLHRGLVQNQGR